MTTDRPSAPGSAADGPYALDIDPERAGWGYSTPARPGAAAGRLAHLRHRGQRVDRAAAERRLHGRTTDGETFELQGRESVFSGVTDFAYVPRDARAQIASGAGGRFALAGARCERRLPARYGPAPEVPVELRGTGNCSRQVNNFAAADVFECDKLIAVEVLTPGGNWSSYPPHKHDEHRPGEESELEEIYYFEIAGHDGTAGLGYQRVSPSGPGGTDVLAEVRDGDAVLIPDGWHGPSIAVPGHDMYYLNVMAGPGAERAWLICDHPDHAWIRGTWPEPARRPPPARSTRADRDERPAIRAPTPGHPPPDRRPGPGARSSPRQYTERDGAPAPADRRHLGHLRPRQRRRARPGAASSTGAGRHAATTRAATSRPWCTRPSATPASRNRLSAHAVTTSIGPGATNLVTGAALATINRLPGAAAARRHLRDPPRRPGAPAARSARTRATCPSTTRCAPSPATSTGSPAPRR